ncbi:hypothetical protein BJ508DRAFT_10933 [Ascobolus immersus RN42]|uniref:Uncharacterized protein n=1 Tax=Ascobolus immersus RN42 TaxID=1160509 RepID=A0A3N4HQV0_ASCIM|nr:hypothetical protein BJ508DRAFT_10933 [Ascobolus immersus RN42]
MAKRSTVLFSTSRRLAPLELSTGPMRDSRIVLALYCAASRLASWLDRLSVLIPGGRGSISAGEYWIGLWLWRLESMAVVSFVISFVVLV